MKEPVTYDIPMQEDKSPEVIIWDLESEIRGLENELHYKKAHLARLKTIQRKSVTIRWRESSRWCISQTGVSFLKSSTEIANCIAANYAVDADAEIRNKIATTLSLMHKEGEIGRYQYNKQNFYGLSKYFNDDLTSIKMEYADKIPPGYREGLTIQDLMGMGLIK